MTNLWLDHPRGPWMITFTGRQFHPLDPRADEVDVCDIAHALANICRFGGHSRHHYSVAQHSVLVSHLVPPELALVGLLHDAAEAYVGDMIAPMKLSGRFEEFVHVEQLCWAAVVEAFNLHRFVDGDTLELPAEVKHADLVALVTEARDVMGVEDPRGCGWPDVDPAKETIYRLAPRTAEGAFQYRLDELWSAP